MSVKTFTMDDRLHEYLLSVSVPDLPPILRELRDETASLSRGRMQISTEQGQFMRLLIALIGAEKCLEIGVFTGYSALIVAQTLPDNGTLIACDISEEYTQIARRYWKKAGIEQKISLRIAPATETLNALLADAAHRETFDFAFIDADKPNYDAYYEAALQLVKPGGLVAIDNTLWSGDVADPDINDEETVALRALNQKIAHDARVLVSVVPIGDGLTLAYKKPLV